MKDQVIGSTEKRRAPQHLTCHEVYEMVKNVHVVLGKWKRTGNNTEEDDMWKKLSIFLLAKILERLRRLSFDWCDARREECVREPPQKIRIRKLAELKKMGIRPELWLNDSVKGTELPTWCITLSKHEKEYCRFLKNVKVPSSYSTNVSRLISFPDLKVAPSVKSHDYHVLLMQMIVVGIQNTLPVNVREAVMNFCFFFNAIGQKVLSEEALETLEKGTLKLYAS
jgi:hypothetical protein